MAFADVVELDEAVAFEPLSDPVEFDDAVALLGEVALAVPVPLAAPVPLPDLEAFAEVFLLALAGES